VIVIGTLTLGFTSSTPFANWGLQTVDQISERSAADINNDVDGFHRYIYIYDIKHFRTRH